MAQVTTKDSSGRIVHITTQPMQGVILTMTRKDRGGRITRIEVALTSDQCRELAADMIAGHQSAAR